MSRSFITWGTRVVAAAVLVVAAPATAAVRGGENAVGRLAERQIRSQLVPVVAGETQISGVELGPQFFPQSVASGDPRPDSVVLWTRVDDAAFAGADVPVRVIVTKDKFFNNVVLNQVVTAKADYDHCVKVKVSGLAPATSYLYFFVYGKGGTLYLSRLGRTKTAPAPGSNVPVRFAYVNCQDYVGRYYNTYLKLLLDHRDDIDFVVHLGDYVYETTGDPSFQSPSSTRKLVFSDVAGAVRLGDPAHPYYGAASLSNYRELYKTYRSDPILQQVHESYPMIAIWDDHEYTDDCWGDVGTYFDGRVDEKNTVRRRNSERAYFEFMPIDYGLDASGSLAISDAILYPNAKIYRDFHFGTNLHLVLTDYRSFRPDHLVPEDAFPGAVWADRPTLEAVLTPAGYAAVSSSLDPYFPIDTNPLLQGTVTAILYQLYQLSNPLLTPAQAGVKAQSVTTGNLSATYINALFAAVGAPPPFDSATLAALDRGLSFLFLGKRNLYDSTGSRYILAKDTFDVYSGLLYARSQGASENAFGTPQQAWIASTLQGSSATWKVLASSVSATPMLIDFTNPVLAALLPPDFPAAYRTRLQINADDWDGFPHKRAEILGLLGQVPNSVLISGDIHASFVTSHGHGVYEFTGGAVSSEVLGGEVLRTVLADSTLGQVTGIEQLVGLLGGLLQLSISDPQHAPPEIAWDDVTDHAFVVVDVKPESLTATYYLISSREVANSYYANPHGLDTLFQTKAFRVQGGQLTPLP